jgi:tetratricopeptide (TPR) repeat protein
MARGPGQHWSKVWLAVAAYVGFDAGAAETDASRSADDLAAITEPLLTSIAEEEARNGPLSTNLVDLLTSLGLAYQENGEDVLAVAVLDRALFLKRVNEGLFGIDQAALVQRLIDSELAIGRVDSAAELREKLLELARRNSGDPRAAAIFRDAAERQLGEYERYLRGEIPPTLTIGGAPGPQQIAAASVWLARRHYNEAIGTLVRNAGEHQAELDELEEGLTRTYYLEASNRHRWYQGVGDPLYALGLVSHLRRIQYTEVGSPTAVDYAQALIELADWSLLFSRNGTAVKRYAEAYAFLVERRVPAASIEQLFPTDTPVFLPAFAPPPFDGAAVAGSTGYVDVDFEIGKYGQPRKVTLIGAVGADAAAVSKSVVAAINNGRFRPSPLADTGRGTAYRLRYALADGSLTPRL